ncbi:hypothetical protein C1752_02139 [Acaryochloris thomasi RCC1774]|uniref:Uncharacterized protein n=1 Tax=Acaryochloris thomasi RCC1774 TaxID=1764569 RepID=A0A2W1JYG2_9CYAN|nr:hypothetical protein [Acaryochloris thomasi]PZD73591.1 hypothetical protein C1752_02139 [Acaryochloris thomasi RCC1774]
MLESCPRCSSRLGPPLKTGRQVCAECGWSSAPMRSRTTPPPPPKTGVAHIVQLCWRIVQRVVRLSIAWLKEKFQGYQETRANNSVKPGQVMAGLSDRLSALEQSIPTSPKAPWITPEEAFEALGGQIDNPNSVVRTVNGQAAVSFARFRVLKSEAEWRAFGFEIDSIRRDAGKSWIRQLG